MHTEYEDCKVCVHREECPGNADDGECHGKWIFKSNGEATESTTPGVELNDLLADAGDDLFTCECGCDFFTYVDGLLRCQKCRNEYKIPSAINGDCESWMRRFNHEEGKYPENWEHCPPEGFGGILNES